MEPVTRLGHPVLRNPVALVSFEGWNDACDAASGVITYLVGQYEAEPFLIIDPEGFVDFHESRPIVEVRDGVGTELSWPATKFYAIHMPDRPHDLVAVLGDEPNYRWQTFTSVVGDVLRQEQIQQVLLLGAFLGQVPHTRPVPLVGTSSDPEKLTSYGIRGTDYRGPTGIVGVLAHSLRAEGFDTMSLWAAVPHYLGSNPNPKAMLALLDRAAGILDISVDATELSEIAGDFERRVDVAMGASTEFKDYIAQLEEAAETEEPGWMDPQAADTLISEVEEFLKEN